MDEARFKELVDEYAEEARSVVGIAGGLRRAVELCEKAPDDDHLLVLSVIVLDPLLDMYWDEIGSLFEEEMKRSVALRKAWSGTMPHIPQDAIDRLDGLLRPGEDVGRSGA